MARIIEVIALLKKEDDKTICELWTKDGDFIVSSDYLGDRKVVNSTVLINLPQGE